MDHNLPARTFTVIAFGVLTWSSSVSYGQLRRAQVSVPPAPEFVFLSPKAEQLTQRARAAMGVTHPTPIRIVGKFRWGSSGKVQDFDRAIDWPGRYRKQDDTYVHLLGPDGYSTNSDAPKSLYPTAEANVASDALRMSILLLARPTTKGVRVGVGAPKITDNRTYDTLIATDGIQRFTLLLGRPSGRVDGVATPAQFQGREVERLTIVVRRDVVRGVSVPAELLWITGTERDSAIVKATVGSNVSDAFRLK